MSNAFKKRYCHRCQFTWSQSNKRRPKRCPKCNSKNWDSPFVFSYDRLSGIVPDTNAVLGRFFKSLVTIVVILCVGTIIFLWASSLTVECDVVDQVDLSGFLRGFERNGSYWNVALDNLTFLFGVWDQNYMRSFIGFDITISCCWRYPALYDVGHYDMRMCRICGIE